MNNHRLELHEKLCTLLGTRDVFFQPPENIKIPNRAIIYQLTDAVQRKANNKLYNKVDRYQVLFITPNPDDRLWETILEEFEIANFERHYKYENLNYYSISIYY